MIQIELMHEDGLTGEDWFYPGELVLIRIGWELPQENCLLKLQVLWETEGKGTDQSETAHEESWTVSTVRGEKTFEWLMPRGPLSCEGMLLKIRWYVDCYVETLGIKARKPMQLSTSREPVRLMAGKLPPEAEKVMKLFGYTPPSQSNPTT